MPSRRGVLLVSFLACISVASVARAAPATGFAREGMWISPNPAVEQEDVRIVTALFNTFPEPVEETVVFYEGAVRVGTTTVRVPGGGHLAEATLRWRARPGTFHFSAKVERIRRLSDGTDLAITPVYGNIGALELIVEKDTDGDGIPDTVDTDDDNDGVSDLEEVRRGTNPFVFDHAPVPAQKSVSSVRGTTTVGALASTVLASSTVAASILPVLTTLGASARGLDKKIEQTRARVHSAVEAKREVVLSLIRSSPTTSASTGEVGYKRPLAYLNLAGLSFVSLWTANRMLLYLAIGILLFIVSRLFLRFWREYR